MKNRQNQRIFSDIMKVRKSKFRKEKFESNQAENAEIINDPMAFQLPTVIVSGAKKCGTKTLMRFFGHHPQVIIGRVEAPFHQSGDDQFDVKSYLQLLYRVWKLDENVEKLNRLPKLYGPKASPIFMAKTGNKGIKKIIEFIAENPDFIPFPYIKTWAENVQSITGDFKGPVRPKKNKIKKQHTL